MLTRSLDIYAVQFFPFYSTSSHVGNFAESWTGVKELLKDCCSLCPPSTFLALSIMRQFEGGHKPDGSRNLAERQQECESKEVTVSIYEKGTFAFHATIALAVLVNLVATVMEIIYRSEKVRTRCCPALLTIVMYKLVPYIRTHTTSYLPMLYYEGFLSWTV